jgi:scyllo-inositol 2-dehydrogenase (NADP+)
VRAALVGLGKMGLSHFAIVNAHPRLQLQAVCDSSKYLLEILGQNTGVKTYSDYDELLAKEQLDCLFIATPSSSHAILVEKALRRGLAVFCEKPFVLDPAEGYRLADLADSAHVANQVGYHYRFVATFAEAKRLLGLDLLGHIHHVRAEAYGPVVLRPAGSSWRSKKTEGGGALFDYACHAIDMLNNLFGLPSAVSGTIFNSVFSEAVDDEIYSNLLYAKGMSGQLAVNWSDESTRKMSLRIHAWGTNGRMSVDRQEMQIYLRKAHAEEGLEQGWNTRDTTSLTKPVWFYLRGEEYSAQIDHFVECIERGITPMTSFRTASDTDLVAGMMRADSTSARTAITFPGRGAAGAIARPVVAAPRGLRRVARWFGARGEGSAS